MSSLQLEISSGRTNKNNNTYGYADNNNSIMQKPLPATSAPASAQLIQGKEVDPLESSASTTCDPSSAALESSEDTECDPFLASTPSIRRGPRPSSSSVLRSRKRMSWWARAHGYLTRNWYLGCLVPACILGALVFIGWTTRDYARQLLFWIEMQNAWITFAVYMALFALVSFPVVVGYFVLLITAGYLFGCLRGWLTVILGANLGIALAHATIRSCRHRIPVQRLIKNDTGRAILRVISGPKAFRVVLFTRLTPIPFGVQNVIFGVICGVALMFWVLQKARKELSETLLSADYNNEGKHSDIQV
ncbi:uncharacterized protein LOC108030811 isoform X2 [Drosophila biarmipes]|uniref:uncharacterized protein LOC108030811 isoform X2 n=1 Tax=Drosophila biarmipes TaxID=125945 RepID=UPI0007E6721E|nr:uncharacterized protein LOC108030811 isoform X2 [Drosophila biarmipes]